MEPPILSALSVASSAANHPRADVIKLAARYLENASRGVERSKRASTRHGGSFQLGRKINLVKEETWVVDSRRRRGADAASSAAVRAKKASPRRRAGRSTRCAFAVPAPRCCRY